MAATSLEKVPSGIAGFDLITSGGLPRDRITLVCGGAGCGKTLFGMEFLVNGARAHGEPGVFISFEESRGELAENVASLGFDIKKLVARKLLVIDHILIDRREIQETGEYDLEGLFVRIDHAIKEIGAKRVVLDTLEALFSGFENEARAPSCAACSTGSSRAASPRSSPASKATASSRATASRSTSRTA